jgi:chemotaxis family two-component system sensor histidine kinase/response regulator PixL
MTEEKNEAVHVLVVEDHALLLMAIADILECELGYTVHQAANGVEALPLLAQHDIDIALVNWLMPEMNGLELIDYMHEKPRYAKIPIVLFSAKEIDILEEIARTHGLQGFFQKPFEPDDVCQIVEGVLKDAKDAKETTGF